MSAETKIKTCGRDPSCDLVIEHSTLSRIHARIELADDGLVSIRDAGSSNGTFLNRNDSWIRASKVILCIGDLIRFGDIEVPLEKLTAVFGKRATTRLESKRFPVRPGNTVARRMAGKPDHARSLQKPRRNPATGKIEDKRTVNNQT